MQKSLEDTYSLCESLNRLGEVYFQQKDYVRAEQVLDTIHYLARPYGLKDLELKNLRQLARLDSIQGDLLSSYQRYQQFTSLKDSLEQWQVARQLVLIETEDHIRQKEAEIKLLRKDQEIKRQQEKWRKFIMVGSLLGMLLLGILALVLVRSNRQEKQANRTLAEKNEEINQQNEEIAAQRDRMLVLNQSLEKEREKTDRLLLNILPQAVAEELKTHGQAKVKTYHRASILFTDFEGFTRLSETMNPDQLIEELNECFVAFDEIIRRHNLEKIKTIGDAYMCIGGIPEPNVTNPVDTVLAGLEIQHFMRKRREAKQQQGEAYWQCRLGINTGEIRAGVIGTSKFAYDAWGSAVNIAARMESGGEIDQVNISQATYEWVKDFFECEYRGEIEVKNQLILQMYFVRRLHPELSSDNLGLQPNHLYEQRKDLKFAPSIPA
ncbi:MAG: hypothetical protein HC880_06185 [Bacteroidia bacterium]|nr:hypothetical protein [Bacteroidia bacterium]